VTSSTSAAALLRGSVRGLAPAGAPRPALLRARVGGALRGAPETARSAAENGATAGGAGSHRHSKRSPKALPAGSGIANSRGSVSNWYTRSDVNAARRFIEQHATRPLSAANRPLLDATTAAVSAARSTARTVQRPAVAASCAPGICTTVPTCLIVVKRLESVTRTTNLASVRRSKCSVKAAPGSRQSSR